jgi:hypothetical protein
LYLSPLAGDDRQSHLEAVAAFTPVARARAETETCIQQSVVRPPLLACGGGDGAVPHSAAQQQRRHPQPVTSATATPLVAQQRLRLDAAGGGIGNVDRVPFASAVSGAKSVGDENLHTADHEDDDIYSLSVDELAQRIDAGEDAYIRYRQLLVQRCQHSVMRS